MIAAGHPPDAVWQYTPRQMAGFLYFANRRRERELKESLAMQTMAHRGDGKDIQRMLRDT